MDCPICGKTLHPRNKSGLCTATVACRKHRNTVYNHRRHGREQRDRYREEHPEIQMWWSARARAACKDVPFKITKQDILNVWTDVCPIFNHRLERFTGNGTNGSGPWSPTLDRIVPELGYVPGNIQVISNRANMMKGNATPDELLQFAAWIQAAYGAEGGD